jgi:hypothetical protein
MPGSSTTPGRSDLAMVRPKRVAFRARNSVGARGLAFAAPWLAYALPYRRFVGVLTDANARLGADVDRYTFIVVDLHHLLLAGLPAHLCENPVICLISSPPRKWPTDFAHRLLRRGVPSRAVSALSFGQDCEICLRGRHGQSKHVFV